MILYFQNDDKLFGFGKSLLPVWGCFDYFLSGCMNLEHGS